MSFPLLRLPDVALEKVVRNYDHNEIIHLALTSLRAKCKISRHTKKHFIRIFFCDTSRTSYLQILSNGLRIPRILVDWGRGPSWRFQAFVPIESSFDTVSHWKRDIQDFREILDFLNEIFRIEDFKFFIDSKDPRFALLFMEHVASKNLNIRRVDWPSFAGNEEMAERLLMASKGAIEVEIKGLHFRSIRFDHFHLYRMDQLRIEHASWITADQVANLRNCEQVRLGNVRLITPEINKILLEYSRNPGQLRELRMQNHCRIKMREAMKNLKNLEIEEKNGARDVIYWFTTDNGVRFSVTKAWRTEIVVIKRDLSME
uniref:F-box domain-containing protein n=1 Tax=Caenorhabditis tropicalis TaxID=1561998 RepID=A0A1I7UT94_9PELO